ELVGSPSTCGKEADLGANRHHRFEKRGVGLANFAAEELHRAHDVRTAEDGQRECGVESDAFGGRRARKVAIDDDVRNPRRTSARPYPSGQADAAGERRPSTEVDKLCETRRIVVA